MINSADASPLTLSLSAAPNVSLESQQFFRTFMLHSQREMFSTAGSPIIAR